MTWQLQIRSGSRQGKTVDLTGEYITIGRAADNTVCFSDGSVSEHHAMLTGEGDSYKLWDLHSAHGTLVNGERIVVRVLKDGDQLRIGTVELRCECAKPAAPIESSSPAPQDPRPQAEESKPEPVPVEQQATAPAGPVAALGAGDRSPGGGAPQPVMQPSKDPVQQPPAPERDLSPKAPAGRLRMLLIYVVMLVIGLGVFFGGYPTRQEMLKFIGLVLAAVAAVSLVFMAMFGGVIPPHKKQV